MGLIVSIYRNAGRDTSNDGVTSRHDKVCVINIEGPFDPSPDCPAMELVPHASFRGHCFLRPITAMHTMFGGAFGYTSDSRFSEAVRKLTGVNGSYAIQIHDRIE